MSRLARHHSDDEESSIDLTPMLDVVFIMLIFFIVTASFIKESGLVVSRPDAQNNDTESEIKNIVFQITATDEIWLEGRRIDVRSVRANVERLHAKNPQGSVVLQAHPKAHTDTLTQISDQSREAGVDQISLTINEKQ
ncbi:MAG: biopolymer transporter ExbD [Cellvibrionales bacterium]|nr:biopolymer transporter ExbD [Cellvibrionales bacterium]